MKGLRGCHIGQGRGRSAGSHLPLRRPPAHRPAARPLRRPCSCSAVSNATDALTAEQQSTWDACRQHLLDMGVKDETEADKILRQSFGWAGQAFWSSEKVEEMPSVEQLDAVTEFLTTDAGLKESDVAPLASKFPQVFGCDVDTQLREALQVMTGEWKMTGPVLAAVLKRNPKTLGCNVDCGGTCIGQCDRCWVRY